MVQTAHIYVHIQYTHAHTYAQIFFCSSLLSCWSSSLGGESIFPQQPWHTKPILKLVLNRCTWSFRARSQEHWWASLSLCGWLLVQVFTRPVRRPWVSCLATQANVDPTTSLWIAALTRTYSPSPPHLTTITRGQCVQQSLQWYKTAFFPHVVYIG